MRGCLPRRPHPPLSLVSESWDDSGPHCPEVGRHVWFRLCLVVIKPRKPVGCPGARELGVPAPPGSVVVCRQVVGSYWVLSSCPTVFITFHPSRCCLDLAHYY